MATASPRRNGRNYTENILKQGYLKKSVQSSELGISVTKQLKTNIKQKLEPLRWYVFGVRNRIPYLEYFDKEESVFTGRAIETFDLSSFQRLSYTMSSSMPWYSFCIFLSDGTIELAANTRPQMIEWCRTIERHLRNLGFRVKNKGEDHLYSEFPIRYEPRKTGLEAEIQMEEALRVNLPDDNEEEEDKENEYEDIPVCKNHLKDENDNDKAPEIPKRPHEGNQNSDNDDDIVFASLYSVARDSSDPLFHTFTSVDEGYDGSPVCDNFESYNDEVSFDFAISDIYNKVDKTGQRQVNKTEQITDNVDDDEENKCTSLPIFPTESTGTSGDTSEDSDFIGASFWLKNRKTQDLILFDEDDPNAAKRKLPPQPREPTDPPPVPRRLQSIRGRSLRQTVSMNEDLLNPKSQNKDRLSPTLELLGQAPTPFPEKGSIKTSPELPKRILKGSKSHQTDYEPVEPSKDIKIKNVTRMDRIVSADLDDDEVGDYEHTPSKIQEDGRNGVDADSEGIYEPAWMCKSRRDDSPHKEKLMVDMPNDVEDMYDNNSKSSTHEPKNKLSIKKFLKKSKQHNLPSELIVSMSTRHNVSEENADGNLYSDLPFDNVPKVTPKTPEAAHSDLCKLSLENGPSRSVETSPELPRRNKAAHNSRSSEFFEKGQTLSSEYHITSQNSPPHPPRKLATKSSADDDVLMRRKTETPVAPPRRNRKTIHVDSMNSSSNGENHKTVINPLSQSCNENFYQPKRDLPPVPDDPPLPPKPALPPPRKGAMGGINNDYYKPDIPVRGSRPKSINIMKRQVSTESTGLTVMNLKQNQVDILKSEIEATNGMEKTISKVQFQNGLALVECFERIWIVGWDLKNFPRLYDKFHIGDQLIAINEVYVSELSFALKMVKNVKVDTIDVTIKRLPMAKVYALQRDAEGQNLGFKRDGGTAEIIYIDPHGVAAKHGLQSKANTFEFSCNWCLTEINMRPLNLFFKDSEIEHRLMAVGKDISIIVQPADFIKELKKQLKKLKGYKEYLVQ